MRLQDYWISVLNLLGLSEETQTPQRCTGSWNNWISKSKKLDYEKIIHICKERIRQLENGE